MTRKFLLIGALLMGSGSVAATDNVHFSGALVAEPCTLSDKDTDIHLDFGTVDAKYLYTYQRTLSQPFTLHLETCDPALMSTVSVNFQGTADSELTDMLALDVSSSAKGVAIGLVEADGTLLPINKASSATQLTQGNTTLQFGGFIQIQPTALQNKALIVGDFTAVSTFVLLYQ